MFHKILIANRGEIACRVAATARRLGIRTVAVHSDVDAQAQHVRACDEAVALGGAAASQSYLRADRILEAARVSGAQAVHPGYGFLSENAAFAEACAAAGRVFIGPPPAAIAAMGSKSAAKALMARAGVPLVPGYHGPQQDAGFLLGEADRIGYPVLIKASAGGGGKGMRRVDRPEDFIAALAACQREAQASFGDHQVLLERHLIRPRHIEIQVFADAHGGCVHLFERDCSVQRRHQKVLEEAPAPGITPERRAEMGAVAVAAARAVGYVGAGTVEFIAEPAAEGELRFFFMEMNTRLQVEHPVTEAITGLDLVEWQLRVAAGEPLPLRQEAIRLRGHAIEARLCAEHPEAGFLPASGCLQVARWPAHQAFGWGGDAAAAPVRLDAGLREGDEISPHYDPLIAKLICWGEDRAQALARLEAALAQTRLMGLHTNAEFLRRVLRCGSFSRPDLDTALIEREQAALFGAPGLPLPWLAAGVAAAVLLEERAQQDADPWSRRDGWRLHGAAQRVLPLAVGDALHTVELLQQAGALQLRLGGPAWAFSAEAQADGFFDIALGPERQRLAVHRAGRQWGVFSDSSGRGFAREVDPLQRAGAAAPHAGALVAPMPGKLLSFLVAPGQQVSRGQPLAVMEAMKMEHTVSAPRDGQVAGLLYRPGDQVPEGAELLRLAPERQAP